MSAALRFALASLLVPSTSGIAVAQDPMQVDVVGTAANHELSWVTAVDYNYQVFMSVDLDEWLDIGISEPGTGSTIAYGLSSNAEELFYRVHETPDPYNGGFLVRPIQDEEVDLIDGVCFAFNLNLFETLPAGIRVYRRQYDSGDPWEQIGLITDLDEIDDIKFVRGSTVWLPDAEDEYEVQAAVIDDTGAVIASAVRRVFVGANQPPTITITGGPTSPSASGQFAAFTTSVSDPDGDEIRRVEFYDNGVLIGTDREAPFGDLIEDLDGFLYDLLRGPDEDDHIHEITAKAYDSRGAVGETAAPFEVVITGGNSRPTLEVTSPSSGLIVTQGQSFAISYNVDDEDGPSNLASVEVYNLADSIVLLDTDSAAPFNDLTVDTTGWEPGTHTLNVVAWDNSFASSYPHYLTIYVRTGSGQTFAERLVANITDGDTAAPSNESFAGQQASSDEFTNGMDSGLELDSGVVLTSGLFSSWNAGNESEVTEHAWNGQGDLELEDRVAGDFTRDAAVLEFDAFCLHGQLEVVFQFGSEEYVEYVSDQTQPGCFNDAFMLSVDGVVVSLLPDCTDIVAVNSVHRAIAVEESFGCLSEDLDALNEHLYLDDAEIEASLDPENLDVQVEYDGMTIRLRAHAFVTPNQNHRVRLVIADVNDALLDSALFIGEGSVRTVPPTP